MGVRNSTAVFDSGGGTPIVQATETTLLIAPPVNIPLEFAQLLIFWSLSGIVGTGQTGWDVTVRRGTTSAGTRINRSSANTVVAGNLVTLSGVISDTPGAVAGQQYCVGINVVGGSASGTLNDGHMIVFAL